eukprot:UN23945
MMSWTSTYIRVKVFKTFITCFRKLPKFGIFKGNRIRNRFTIKTLISSSKKKHF